MSIDGAVVFRMYLASPLDRESLREAIYALRASGITLKEIALRAEIEQSTLYNFMNGRTRRLAGPSAEKLRAFVEQKLVEEVHPTLLESLQARAMKKGAPGIAAAYFKPLVRPTTDLIHRYAGLTCGLHTADDRGEPTFSAFLHISKSISGNTVPIAVKRPRKGNSELSYDGALVDLGTMLLAIASDESNRLFLAILESVLRTTAIMLLGYEVQTNSNAELIIKRCVGLRLDQEADADHIDDGTIAELKESLSQR
jgi:transcriptional regulator with XRE-family HTH domain